MKYKIIIFVLLIFGIAVANVSLAADRTLLMATTTSADNTGLLDYLAPKFQQASGINLKWTATGTGKALKLGENCDVSVLLVHSPIAEKKFVQAGYGVMRTTIMHNSFVLVGPKTDAAHAKGVSVVDAFKQIAKQHALFISRGDDSGTNKKELDIWRQAKIVLPEKSSWYLQSGQGMLATLLIAAEKHAYTLTDEATYIKFAAKYQGKLPLVILIKGDKELINKYSVIVINPQHCKNAQYVDAKQFRDWMSLSTTKNIIANYKLLGKRLFVPYDN